MMRNKKGIEPVIATVLLIVITIVAVALVVSFIVPFVQKQLQSSQVCFNARIEVKADESCYNDTTNVVKVTRGAEDFKIADMIIKLSNGTTTNVLSACEKLSPPSGCVLPFNKFDETTYYIPVTISPLHANSVAVAPVVQVGQTNKVCDVTSQVTIQPCV